MEDTPADIANIHRNVLNPELEKEVEDAFALFDRDGNGEIDFFECQAAFRALRLNASRDAVTTMFAEIKKGQTDVITLADFKTLVLQVIHKRYTAGEAAKIFALLEDGSGKITMDSLRTVVADLGSSIDDEDLRLMISEASGSKNYVTYDDFKRVLKAAWRGDAMGRMEDTAQR
ncbi:centrin [Babesia ovata]|uniref:Centrin n=1 Tax=Babesia ovata TaxID=189622 RepID=A0A2H6K730_9APIC|nr:centrin [Babesia ovata]GBE58806.1 centrin [Babesia ovata]